VGFAVLTFGGSFCLAEVNGNKQIGLIWQGSSSLGIALSPGNFIKKFFGIETKGWLQYLAGSIARSLHGFGTSATLNYEISTCQSIKCLATGEFNQTSISLGEVWGVSAGYSWGTYGGSRQGRISVGEGFAEGVTLNISGQSSAPGGFRLLSGSASKDVAQGITHFNTSNASIWAIRTLSRETLSAMYPRA